MSVPLMIPRGLDHVVHAVRDLPQASALYQRLGFQVSARNVHPWGTHNAIVQLPGFFIELLAVAEPDKLGGEGLAKHFGAFQQTFLHEREGLSMLVLSSLDARRDAESFAQAGIARSEALTFTRIGENALGAPVNVGFTLAFAADPLSPETGFAICQHLTPDAFWSRAKQVHANGAVRVLGAVLVADNPTDHHIFLSSFSGVRDIHATSAGIDVKTPRGDIHILSPVAFSRQYGVEWRLDGEGACFGAVRVAVADIGALQSQLADAKIAFIAINQKLIVPPEAAMGATLIFEPETEL